MEAQPSPAHAVGDRVEKTKKTTKGKPEHHLRGFAFTEQKPLSGGHVAATCSERERGCKARLRLHGDLVTGVIHAAHSHPPNPDKLRAAEVRTAVRDAIQAGPEQRSRAVVEESIDSMELTQRAEALLPKKSSIVRSAQRMKKRELGHGRDPRPREFDFGPLPDSVSLHPDGGPFLFSDEGQGDERQLIFGSRRGIQLLSAAKHAFSDGTFKTCPAPFTQLYSIAVEYMEHHVVVLYCLMVRVRSEDYARLFTSIKDLSPQFAPERWIMDFEASAHKACLETFGVTVQGCSFHLGQSHWRKVQGLGLAAFYVASEGFRSLVGQMTALSLAPPDSVVQLFEQASTANPIPLEAVPYLEYVQATYIGRVAFGQLVEPLFPVRTWNFFDATIGDSARLFRTNNCLEGMHNALKMDLGIHSGLFPFLSKLARRCRTELRAAVRGELGELPHRGAAYVAADKRIVTLARTFHERDPMDYLRAQAANIGAKH